MDTIVVELIKKLFELQTASLEDSECGGGEFRESLDMFESEIRDIVARGLGLEKYSLAVSAYIKRK
jgi:hypothetical protein